jgi:hypothetical protein
LGGVQAEVGAYLRQGDGDQRDDMLVARQPLRRTL